MKNKTYFNLKMFDCGVQDALLFLFLS